MLVHQQHPRSVLEERVGQGLDAHHKTRPAHDNKVILPSNHNQRRKKDNFFDERKDVDGLMNLSDHFDE